jgi:hypothetical protein
MSIPTPQQGRVAATIGDSISDERFEELQEVIARLQILVCELLLKNQQLRFQRADD